jgi:hypothetical protein
MGSTGTTGATGATGATGTGAGLTDVATVSAGGAITQLVGSVFLAAIPNGGAGQWTLYTSTNLQACAIVVTVNDVFSNSPTVGAAQAFSSYVSVSTFLNGSPYDMPFTLMVRC